MNDEQKYKKALEKIRDGLQPLPDGAKISGVTRAFLEEVFPELKESEDEKIRKALVRFHKSTIDVDGIKGEEIVAWLEKQGEKDNWCHHKVDLSNCSEEYRKAYYDGWNNCNMQHSQEKSESNDVVKCLINGMKFYYEDNKEATWGTEKFSMKVKDIIAWLEKQKSVGEIVERCKNSWYNEGKIAGMLEGLTDDEKYQQGWHDALEKQGEQKVPINDFKAKNWYVSEVDGKIHDMTYNPTDKAEPKFKVRDWIINDQGSAFQIAYIDTENCRYVFEIGGYTKEEMNYENIAFANNHYRKWTLDDAKDGDILACGDKVTDCPFIFHNLTKELNPRSYCGVNTLCHFQDNDENGGFWCKSDEVRPATKEQRDTLFAKMKEAGYQWNPDKKELKKVDKKIAWSEDDERIVTVLMEGFRYHQLFNPTFGEVPNAEIISWIKSLKERLS